MIALQPLLALIVLTPLPLAIWLLHRYGVKARPEQINVRERTAEVAGELEETLGGITLVKAYGLEDDRLARYRAVTLRLLERKLRFARLTAGYVVAAVNLPVVSTAAVVIVGARLAIHGQLSVVQFSVFYTYLVMLAPSIATIGVWIRVSETAVAVAGRLDELLVRECRPRLPDADQLQPDRGVSSSATSGWRWTRTGRDPPRGRCEAGRRADRDRRRQRLG